MNDRSELPPGTLDLLILRALALQPQHGWGISERVQQMSSDVLRIQQGWRYTVCSEDGSRVTGHVGKQPPRQIL